MLVGCDVGVIVAVAVSVGKIVSVAEGSEVAVNIGANSVFV